MLKIGISSCFFYPDKNRATYPQKTLQYMEKDLVVFFSHQKVLPVLLPDVEENLMTHFLEDLDGLVLHGGVDMCPTSYGETHIDQEKWPGDSRRDRYELLLLKISFKLRKPVLGICRGCQVLNVFMGGSLFQDLMTQKEGALLHRDADIYDKLSHEIVFHPGGHLYPLYGKVQSPKAKVNTVHHQGIKVLGKDLMVEAICPEDQQVEAISYVHREKQFALGVQWHPEYSHALGEEVLAPEPLLQLFLEECRKDRKDRKGKKSP